MINKMYNIDIIPKDFSYTVTNYNSNNYNQYSG